ncbi:hypothetical protein ACIBI9_50425 [Nonomuraea sp. NPDC050451]
MLRRDTCAAVGAPSRIDSIGEEERRQADMKTITCVHVAVSS